MSSSEPTARGAARVHRTLPGAAAAGRLAALLVAVALAGCGFHLRGEVTYAFSSLYVSAPTAPQFGLELQRMIESGGATRVVDTPKQAQALLDVTNVTDDKGVLSLSSGGRVREYLLTKRVTFTVHDASGRDWLPPSSITIRRSYPFNESEVLAREAQEQRLLKEMQTDAVQQIVRRLQAAKRPAS
jgi:LPS-assembly lipoprotein